MLTPITGGRMTKDTALELCHAHGIFMKKTAPQKIELSTTDGAYQVYMTNFIEEAVPLFVTYLETWKQNAGKYSVGSNSKVPRTRGAYNG